MKSLFFTTEELNTLIKEFYNNENVKIGFSEELGEDVIEWYDQPNRKLVRVTSVDELILFMDTKYNVSIESIEIVEYKPLSFGYILPFS